MTVQTKAPLCADPREEMLAQLPSLRAYARGLTGNVSAADDLVQETVLKAWSKFDQFQEGSNLRAWLFTIMRNTFLSGRRKGAREVADTDGSFAARLTSKPDHDGRLALQELTMAMRRLPVAQREALILVGALGFSIEEAAQTCACAPGTIKSRVNRGRMALAEMLHLNESDQLETTDSAVSTVLAARPESL